MKFVTRPLFWLLAQAAMLFALCVTLESFETFPEDLDYYLAALREMEAGGLRGILSNVRTFGYPGFLKIVEAFSPQLQALPVCQLACRVLAVLVFYAALRRIGVGGWLALCQASVLYYANAVFSTDAVPRVSQIMSEVVGESFLILATGCLFFVLSRPASVGAWLALSLSVFLTYQVRPSFQVLIVVFPVLGFVLLGLVARAEWLRLRWRVGLGLVGACVLPFLAWCTFRLLVVGHFGLVSFLGNTLGGIAGLILTSDDALVDELPPEHREFALAVLMQRDNILNGKVEARFGPWRRAYEDDGSLIWGTTEDDSLYVFAQHDLFYAVADRIFPNDPIQSDRKQWQVALAIIKARPGQYVGWVLESLVLAPVRILSSHVVLLVLLFLLVLLAGYWHVVYLFRWLQVGPEILVRRRRVGDAYSWELNLILLLALGIAVMQVVVVGALVAYIPRYYDTAGVFLPCVVVCGLAMMGAHLRTLFAGTGPPPREGTPVSQGALPAPALPAKAASLRSAPASLAPATDKA